MIHEINFGLQADTIADSFKNSVKVRSKSDLRYILKRDLGFLKADEFDISFRPIEYKVDGLGDIYCVEYTCSLGTFIMGWSDGALDD